MVLISNREVIVLIRTGVENDSVVEALAEKYGFNAKARKLVKEKVDSLRSVYRRFMKKFRGGWDKLQAQKAKWLSSSFEISQELCKHRKGSEVSNGKDQKSFAELSKRSQRRKVAGVIDQLGTDTELMAAVTQRCAIINKDHDMARIIKKATESDNKKQTLDNMSRNPIQATPKQALSLLIRGNMSSDAYSYTRKFYESLDSSANVPPYSKVSAEKKACCPPTMHFTASSAEAPWDSALPFSIDKIIESQMDMIIENCKDLGNAINAKFIFSCGLDGSGRQQKYNQELKENVNESTLVAVSFIGLPLVSDDGTEIYRNKIPHSHRSCRTQKIFFGKEDKETIKAELKKIEDDIAAMENHVTELPTGQKLFISYDPKVTLCDGKVASIGSDCDTFKNCYVCGCPPAYLNFYDAWKIHVNFNFKPDALKFCLHPLHLKLNTFRYLFNLSCRLHVDRSKSQARGKDAEIAKERKKLLQERFRQKLNIRVEEVREHGGTSTDGNVVNRAFEDTKVLAEILELDFTMVDNLVCLVRAVSSHYEINVAEFQDLCDITNGIIRAKYGNIPKSSSIHLLLDHGAEIINAFPIPVGDGGEHASESKNKHLRNDRQFHARKDSRVHAMEDVFRMSWARSCPVILSQELKSEKKTIDKEIPPKLRKLLIIPA